MKLNEILVIGGALVAALVLSKSRGLSSPQTNDSFNNPFSDLLGKAQTQAVQKLESNVDTLESVRQSNLSIAKNILGYERNLADVNISGITAQINEAQKYLSQQQKTPPGSLFGLEKVITSTGPLSANQLVSKFMESFNRFGGFTGQSIYPDVNIPFTKSNLQLAEQAQQYETAQKNITSTNEFINIAHNEISKLQKEYQTKYGNLSRYG